MLANPAQRYAVEYHALAAAHPEVPLASVALAPDLTLADPLPLYHIAERCRKIGHVSMWRRGVDLAFSCPHRTPEQLFARARAKLALGDWSGWADYESRHAYRKSAEFFASFTGRFGHDQAMWDGVEDLSHKTLLLYAEHGFGSTIQMLRFVPRISTKASSVILAVRQDIAGFVYHNLNRYTAVTLRNLAFATPFDRCLLTMSLPNVIGALPAFTPLSAPRRVDRSYTQNALRIGICWRGSDKYAKNEARSMPLSALEPLLTDGRFTWYSLCVDAHAHLDCAGQLIAWPDPPLTSFADTASFIASLDYVVTVDSAVAHLAASLGARTFVLLSTAASWRWGLEDTSAWYPSATLIRQTKAGDWTGVVHVLQRHLCQGRAQPR